MVSKGKFLSDLKHTAVFAKDDFELATPVFGEGNQFPLDLGREVAQDRFVGGMNAQGWRGKDKSRREGRDFSSREVAEALEGREWIGTPGDGSAIVIEGADADPVVECLE